MTWTAFAVALVVIVLAVWAGVVIVRDDYERAQHEAFLDELWDDEGVAS